MTDATNRRDFLRKLAKGAVYSAPVIRTLAAPSHLSAQVSPKMGMMMMTMFMMGNMFMKGRPFMFPFMFMFGEPSSPPPATPPWSTDVGND